MTRKDLLREIDKCIHNAFKQGYYESRVEMAEINALCKSVPIDKNEYEYNKAKADVYKEIADKCIENIARLIYAVNSFEPNLSRSEEMKRR